MRRILASFLFSYILPINTKSKKNLMELRKEVFMKRIRSICGIMLGISITVLNFSTSFAASGTGCLDSVNGQTISGWAWDSSRPETALNVKAVIKRPADGITVAEFPGTAATYREDLVGAGYGTGQYGFSIAVSWSGLDSGIYLVEVYTGDSQLSNILEYNTATGESSPVSLPAVNMRPLGTFKATAYCPCARCCGRAGARTCTGTIPQAGHTISVDPRVVPMGSKLLINGVVYTAEDQGSGVNGKKVDIFFNSHQEALRYGVKRVDVYLLQ